MNIQRPSCVLVVALIATQVFGPAVLWAADQRGIRVEANRRVLIAAISGEQLMVQSSGDSKAMHFRDAVNVGDQIATGDRTVAEVLIGNRAVVTLGQSTTAQFTAVSDEQATVQVKKGIVRVAASAVALGAQGKITIQTPTGQVQTRGGIIRVLVDAPIGSAEHSPTGEARPYRASYSPNTMIAAVNTRGEIIQVEEGTAEIPGAGPGGGTLTVKSGQSVTMRSGQAGSMSGLVTQAGMRAGVLATAGHSSTPKEGLDNLVALQVDQATALGKALTGAAETGGGDAGKTDDKKNVINGATGGVALASGSLLNTLFGTNNSLLSGTGGTNTNRSGSGAIDDSNDQPDRVVAGAATTSVSVKGGAGLLLFTERPNPTDEYPPSPPAPSGNHIGGGATTSNFTATKEFLLVDGGDRSLAPHGGNAPISTLVARAIVPGLPLYGDSLNGNVSLPLQWEGAKQFSGVNQAAIDANAKVLMLQTPMDTRPVLDNVATGGTSSDTNPCTAFVFSCFGSAKSALSDFSSQPDGTVYTDPVANKTGDLTSFVDGAITARSATTGNRLVTLTGGVVLDKGTTISLGTTTATNDYFNNKSGVDPNDLKFNGSLLSVLASQDGGFNPAFVKIQDRALGVLDGSSISGTVGNNVALLSVLDSRLTGPSGSDPSTGANGRNAGEIAPLLEMDGSGGARPLVNVTSAVVVRSTNVTLDGALLSASSPLLAMINASMTTTGHFADLAGKNGQLALVASLVPGDALVRLNNSSILTIQGHLLNLNNATASVTGYLFSLNGGSTLNLNGGTLFSLTSGSSLNLNGNAFGVFGSGANTLSITNNLCTATCFQLVNSANQPFLLNGTALKVAGVTQNVMLPNNFNVFALAPGAPAPTVNITANGALFKVDGTSTLTINGTKVN